MATDNSPPKIRVILTIAFSSVVILGALNFVFKSYFQMMTDEAVHAHLRPAAELLKLREGEQRNLTSGAMPIDKAIALLGSKGRDADKDITPEPSADMGPMVGWVRAPNQAVVDRLTKEAEEAEKADAGAAPTATADGGAATATDGGAVKSNAVPNAATPDAGATPKGAPAPNASPDAGAAPKPGH